MAGRIAGRYARLSIRWRVAAASALLTFAILLLFAVVFGVLAGRQLREDFDDGLRSAASEVETRLAPRLQLVAPRELLEEVVAGGAVIRVVSPGGEVYGQEPSDAPDLGRPARGIAEVGGYRVFSRPIVAGPDPRIVAFLQYAEPTEQLENSLARMRLLLALGVLGGAALALLAGLAVARRAMAPIAELTRAAREIGRTRDPAVSLPSPAADDEVADLARTLDEMLRALADARGETETALEHQRQFVADASHELRTPLTSVLVNLELLEAALSGEDAEIAGSALRSSQRMRRLVADLLLLARADAGRRAPRRPTDLARVLGEAADEAAAVAEGEAVELDLGEDLWVDGVPDDLHRLALNLIENGLRHTPPGTPVRVLARRDGTGVELVVEDEGPGVPGEIRERIFDRFVRGGGDVGAGSGLGLAIVHAVAAAHGGRAAVGERPGGGARFTVRLPACDPPERPRTRGAAAGEGSG